MFEQKIDVAEKLDLLANMPVEHTTHQNTAMTGEGGNTIWNTVLSSLGQHLDNDETRKWVKELKFLAEYEGEIIVAARDALGYYRIKGRIENLIKKRWIALDPAKRPLSLLPWDSVPSDVKDLIPDPWLTQSVPVSQRSVARPISRQTQNPLHKLDFNSFIVGEANKSAAGLARRLAQQENIGANIAYFHGRQGTGKTHILKAIENQILDSHAELSVHYCSAEDFLLAYVDGARKGDTSALRQKVRNVDVFLIDDVQTLSGKKGTDQELLSTIKSVTHLGGKVALSADVFPGDLVGFSARLLSELKGAVSVELQSPDMNLCRAILRQREALIHYSCPAFSLSDEMVDKILRSVRGTGRDIIGILGSIYTETGFGDVSTSMEIVDQVIDRYKGSRPRPTIQCIKQHVIQHFGISKAELEGASKSRHHVYPRHVAMYLCRTLTGKSLPQIAFQFGKRDHTTVLSACRKVKSRLATDRTLCSDIDQITSALHG